MTILVKSLFAKLAISLMFLFSLVGLSVVALTLFTTDLYHQEVSQKLNREVATHIVNETQIIRNGHLDQLEVENLFHTLMIFNPSLEIYLLDETGGILAFSAPPWKVKRQSVAVEPIINYLDNQPYRIIKGDDPRDFEGQKIFSVAPIEISGEFKGYLYVILGGEEYADILQKVKSSSVLSLSMICIIIGLIFSALTAITLFSGLTKRLKHLSTAMQAFEEDNNFDPSQIPAFKKNGDEIDHLTATFASMANKIHSQVDKLQTIDHLRRELVANVSHDLRTPLATLQGYIETLILKDEQLDADQRKLYLEVAIKHCQRLNKLVMELFELAKLDSKETRVTREPFNLLELVQDIVQKFQLPANNKRIELKVSAAQEMPFVYADIGLIERVMENLIENAIKHTPEDGAITLELQPGIDGISITVKDTGAGIPESEIPYIFDRFYQLDKNRTNQDGSSGLGLAIVKRIIELHKSHIHVVSQNNRGAAFSFQLPRY